MKHEKAHLTTTLLNCGHRLINSLHCTHQDFAMADKDCHPINVDLKYFGGSWRLRSLSLVLNQDLELSEVCYLVAELSQTINASSVEVKLQSIKGDIMQLAQSSAGPIESWVTLSYAINHMAPFSFPASGAVADHFPVLWVAYTLLMTLLITPELLIGSIDLTMIDAATLLFGNAFATIKHITWLALTDLHAGQVAFLWRIRIATSGRTGCATGHVLAVVRADQGCRRRNKHS